VYLIGVGWGGWGFALVSHVSCALYLFSPLLHFPPHPSITSNPYHPYLKQWSKECNHYSMDSKVHYFVEHLQSHLARSSSSRSQGEHSGDGVSGAQTSSSLPAAASEAAVAMRERTDKSPINIGDRLMSQVTAGKSARPSIEGSSSRGSKSPNLCAAESSKVSVSGIVADALTSTGASSGMAAVPSASSIPPADACLPGASPADPRASGRDGPSPPSHQPLPPRPGTMEARSETTQEELMEIINQDEFGVSEVPVFAVDPNIILHPPKESPLQPSTVTIPAITLTLGNSGTTPSPGSFSPSSQSAFKPVPGTTTSRSSPENSKASPDPVLASSSGSQAQLEAPKKKAPVMPPFREKPVTLTKFSETFLKGDWFLRMKLLDHIEEVQDNMEAWLDGIERKLAGNGVFVGSIQSKCVW